jgi:hypothetical protein
VSTFSLGLTALGARAPMGRLARRAILPILFAGSISIALGGLTAAPALAAGPQVTIACTTANSCTASGSGFTPSGQVLEQGSVGDAVFSSSYLSASAPALVCATGGSKPVCHEVGGGAFMALLPVDHGLACDVTAPGTMSYTDASTHAVVTKSVTFVGPCVATTTTFSLPSMVDTGWAAATNPAVVTAGSVGVSSGKVTINVNGVFSCSYTAGATSGCTLANMPVGTDQVEASYSGDSVYGPSSASASIIVYKIQAPQVSTFAPSQVSFGGATLMGTVNPEGAATSYYFEYGQVTGYGTTTDVPVPSASVGSGIQPVTVWYDREAVFPNTAYWVRLVATNEDGTTQGNVVQFKTPPRAPEVDTGGATNVTEASASLHGEVNSEWSGATTYHFEYGPTTAYGSQTPSFSFPDGIAGIAQPITGLQPATTYHYRLEATNLGGTTYGADAEFTTQGASTPGPYGVSAVPIYNCLADGAEAYYWAYDETTGGLPQFVGSQASQYDAGSCPGGSSPIVFTPSDHHVYDLVAVDPMRNGCDGNDPGNYDCVAANDVLEGDSSGPASPPFEVG